MKTPEQHKALSIGEFTKAAESYEGNDAGVYALCRNECDIILSELEKETFERLLDCGCGTGPMVSLLSQHWPERSYTGIDLTPKMIEVAQAKRLPNARFVVGDCERLPFDDGSFGVVICSMSFHHYPSPQDFFDGMARVLRPGDKLVLNDSTGGPLLHKGGVRIYSRKDFEGFCALRPHLGALRARQVLAPSHRHPQAPLARREPRAAGRQAAGRRANRQADRAIMVPDRTREEGRHAQHAKRRLP